VKAKQSMFAVVLCVAALALPAMTLANNGVISDSTQPGAANNPSTSEQAEHHGHHHGMFGMLQTLGLSQAQQTQIKTLMTNYKTAHPEGSPKDPAARKQLRDQILAVLTPAQKTKLDAQIKAWRSQHPERSESSESPSPGPTH
jgi:Spy/CpxP family protein refolding chaperone